MGDAAKLKGIHRLSERDGAFRKWGADPFTLVVRAVCERCNNGWSSKLEARSKPYLLKIITGEACSLDRKAQATIAAWCFKTACVFDQVAEDAAIPREYIERFYRDGNIAAGVNVHLAQRRRLQRAITPEVDDGRLSEPIAQLKSRTTVLEPLDLGISKTVIVLGEMVAQVVVFSQSNVEGSEVLAAEAVRIWPYESALAWPTEFTAVTVQETVANLPLAIRQSGDQWILARHVATTQDSGLVL